MALHVQYSIGPRCVSLAAVHVAKHCKSGSLFSLRAMEHGSVHVEHEPGDSLALPG